MRLRSDGLGKTELQAEIVGVKRVNDLVVFFVDVKKPKKWHTRMGFQQKDLRRLALLVLKPKNLLFIIQALFFNRKRVHITETF